MTREEAFKANADKVDPPPKPAPDAEKIVADDDDDDDDDGAPLLFLFCITLKPRVE